MKTVTTTDTPVDIPATTARLEQELAALGEEQDQPQTYRHLAEYARKQSSLRNRLNYIRTCSATLASHNPEIAKLEQWKSQLETWRQTILDERLALGPRDATGVGEGLELSIRTIDYGGMSGAWIEQSRLGQLMKAAGHVPYRPNEIQNVLPVLAWPGSLHDTDKSLKRLRAERDDAQVRLDRALREDA